MNKALTAFVGFFSDMASPRPLGFFRVAVCLLALIQVALLWPYLLQLYGNFGFVQWAVIEANPDRVWLPSVGKIALLLQDKGVSAATCVYCVFSLYSICLLGMLLGWRTRIFAIGAWILHSLTVASGYLSLYGVDTMLHICLFYCAWMPVGESFSLDCLRRGRMVVPSFAAGLSIRVLQLHLCLVYADTGLAKLQGPEWWNGNSIWRAVTQAQFAAFDLSWLAFVPLVAQVFGWMVLVIEVGYPVLIWPIQTRRIWLLATIGLHLGMGLWLFSATMTVMNLSAFGDKPRLKKVSAL